MDTRVYCVYNLARGVFLSSKVTAADGVNEPLKVLKVLVSGLGLDTESGLWICPFSAIQSVPRLFPFDLLYLDWDQRVIEAVEIVPGAEFPPYRREVAGVLVLARQTLKFSQTGRGDRLIIGVEEEIERQIAAADASDIKPTVASARSSAGRLKGLFDKKGKEQRTAVSSVLTEASPSVVTRMAEGAAPAAPTVVEPLAVSAVGPTETPELAKGVPGAAGISAEKAEEPFQSPIFKSTETEETSSNEARDATAGERPVVSTTQAIIEEPASESKSVVIGQQGGVEDLFSNWVDAPSLSSAWIPRNPRPGSAPRIPPAPGAVTATPPDENPPGVEPDSKASDALHLRQIPEPKKAVPDFATVPRETAERIERPRESATAPAKTMPVQTPVPTTTAVSQPPQATTFTVANFAMWQVSAPTAINSLAAVQSQGQTRPATPELEEQAAKVRRTGDQVKSAPVAKSADSPAEASTPSRAARFASEAGLPKESVRTQTATRVRGPLETAGSKPEKSVVAPGTTRQGIAAGIGASDHSQSATSASAESSRVAAKDLVAAIQEKKPSIEAANNSRERLHVKLAETAARPKSPEVTAAVHDTVQTPKPEVPAAKAGVSAPSAASAPKQVKVEPKAVVPVRSIAPKAHPKPSSERTEGNGKSKAGPPSFGERFKRWLNPVAPVSSDRRRAYRRYVPGMVAHYYTGGSPKPHDVADISMTGFYLLTEDRWMPETMIQMTLQKPCAKGERKQSITVLSKIVRRGSDGVAAEFVMPEGLNPASHDIQPSQATDRFTLARFL
ncbi:MAG: hypothetical protein WCA10_02255 [Terracidiphilus sp.]